MTTASYPIADIFYSLQGEGHFVGTPMVFLRMAGCSVRHCHIRQECDEAPWKMTARLGLGAVLDRVRALAWRGSVVCITGGEPTDHDVLPLVSALRDDGYRVHMETSGARAVVGFPLEWLTVSPKLFGAGKTEQRSGHALKVVVRPEWGSRAMGIIDGYDAGTEFFHRYLQPLTVDGIAVNMPQVLEMLLGKTNGIGRWALSTQAHRGWGLK